MNRRFRGPLAIGLVLLALAVVGYVVLSGGKHPAHKAGATVPNKATVTVKCYGGGEKSDLMADPDVVKILASKGITVDFQAMGSIDQALTDPADLKSSHVDCLWPSSAAAQYLFESRNKAKFPGYRAQTVLSSPEVLYSGPETVKALMANHIVQEINQRYYIIDMAKLFKLITGQKQWQDIGSTISGPIGIDSTDAARSNSGFTLALLELRILATGDAYRNPTLAQAKAAYAKVAALREAQGFQAGTSDEGFDSWQRAGAELHSQLYAGYESQVIDQLVKHPEQKGDIKAKIRILYPQPTVMNDHPIMALTPAGSRLIDAMLDPAIQKIAWQRHGFRPLDGSVPDTKLFPEVSLADTFRTVNLPSADVISDFLCNLIPAKCPRSN